ncbi:kynurenine--oxoglutarate transaminase 1 isoform X2 [Suricata suricatta]|uniref:kynurenine--oxoglutarate transaminase 1 isoform X2 n=1 Tax=Suricata suricatta TaxID=37032 RepID=UPI0011559DF2|nr:kynurenine--oxoglutarate transaminase 1 isoform X2 [Suricata suricatta]
MFRNATAMSWLLLGPLQRKKAGTSLTQCLHQTLTMAKRVQARRLDGIDHNPWVEFVKMASEFDAVNLGQGFPDFPPPDFAVEAFQHVLSSDFMLNQYTKAFGYPPLTKTLASFFGTLLGQEIDPLKNVLVTVGAYGALFTAFQALVEEGDEVIIIEPFFDCYEPMTLMAGGRPVFVTLKPGPTQDGELDSSSNWQLDPTDLASKFTSRTKALILNTPNNPVGKVFSKEELELVASLCRQHDVICITDEVYQWLVYDGYQHVSIASLPGMWERTLTIGSAGKTFSATGWKGQAAVARSFEHEQLHFGQPGSYFVQFPRAMQRARDRMMHSLQSVGLKPVVPQGSYFFIADISDFKSKMPDLPGEVDEPYDRRFVKWLIKNKGLVAIPVSTFYSVPHRKLFDHYIRFCFVKDVPGEEPTFLILVDSGTLPQCLYSCRGGDVDLTWASPCSSLGRVTQSRAPSVFSPVSSETQRLESNSVLALSPSPAPAPAQHRPRPCTGPAPALARALHRPQPCTGPGLAPAKVLASLPFLI